MFLYVLRITPAETHTNTYLHCGLVQAYEFTLPVKVDHGLSKTKIRYIYDEALHDNVTTML